MDDAVGRGCTLYLNPPLSITTEYNQPVLAISPSSPSISPAWRESNHSVPVNGTIDLAMVHYLIVIV